MTHRGALPRALDDTAVDHPRLHVTVASPQHTCIVAAARVTLRCRRCCVPPLLRCRRCRLLPQLLAVAAAAADTLCDRARERRIWLGLKAEPARQVNLTSATTFVVVQNPRNCFRVFFCAAAVMRLARRVNSYFGAQNSNVAEDSFR